MCGIALTVNGTFKELDLMGNAIRRRGITSYINQVDNIRVYFTYLPITDITAPIPPYTSGKITLWMNGYISNYKELAEKYSIKTETNCDSEVLAKFIEKTGQTKLNELNGFFSVVYYDGYKLSYFVDRYGIKQLYMYKKGGKLYISSEVKGLLPIMDKVELDKNAVRDWKYSLGVMTDNTIYKGITKVPALPFPKPKKIEIKYGAAKFKLNKLLNRSIERNKSIDVKDGIFLSGGIDSGILANRLQPDYSFSMDYTNELSEIDNIKNNSTGIHYTMICSNELYYQYREETINALDDLKVGSCYTNFALTELASKYCTVLYSGAGADELFSGYPHRYDKEISEVIRRTNWKGVLYDITHEDYDWRYLKGILIVEDRMAGYHAMETRYPFLDNDFVEFALSLPKEYIYCKRILKDICNLHPDVINGKKRGFSNPISNEEWVKFAINEVGNTI